MTDTPKFEDPAELWAALVEAAKNGDEEARAFLIGFEKFAREHLAKSARH